MKKQAILVGAAGILALTALDIPVARGDDCSAATIRGAYALQVTGNAGTGQGFQPIVVVRTAVFDGVRRFTGAGAQSIGGNQSTISVSGTYRVAADCTFTTSAETPSGPNNQFGVVVNGGRKILATRTNPGFTDALVYERVRR